MSDGSLAPFLDRAPFSKPVRHGWIARGTKARYLTTKYVIAPAAKSSRTPNPSQRDELKVFRARSLGVAIATFPRAGSSLRGEERLRAI
jgi:hypothetical protein